MPIAADDTIHDTTEMVVDDASPADAAALRVVRFVRKRASPAC